VELQITRIEIGQARVLADNAALMDGPVTNMHEAAP